MSLHTLILAAGCGSRFNKDSVNNTFAQTEKNIKQLALVSGQSLLQRSVDVARAITPDEVTVVLGYQYELLQPLLQNVRTVINSHWHLGIGNSLARGVAELPSHVSAVLIFLCDQVALGFEDLKLLQACYKSASENNSANIICAEYEGSLGVPAIFPRLYFSQLSALDGDQGAKQLLFRNPTISVPIAAAAIDIDTQVQLGEFIASQPISNLETY